jgi:acetyltransferase-like isoleucine patch superfamily enzyme
MLTWLLEKSASALFRLRFDKVIDIFKRHYHYRRLQALKKQFGSAGKHISIAEPYIIKNPQYLSIGEHFHAMYNLRIEAWDEFQGEQFKPEITIGDNVYFNTDIHIGCTNKIKIGNNVLLASRIYISDHAHGEITAAALARVPALRPLISKGPVIIEDNVWIGEGVCILPGVTIGKNAVIGANAVVRTDIPANSVAGGVPARVLKTLA